MTTQIILEGHSTTNYFRIWLNTAKQPRVLHVFDRACNLIDAEGRVVSLVAPEIGNGPFNLVVPPVRFSDTITPASSIRYDQDTLTIGDLIIDLAPAQLWDSQFPQRVAATSEHIPSLIAVLRDHAVPQSLAGLVVDLPEPGSVMERAILHTAADHTERFIAGLLTLDRRLCYEGAMGLAGLGGGLTPAGDDWIKGCVIAVQVGRFDPQAVSLVRWAVESAAQVTTPLSAAWLRAVSQGKSSTHWHALFDAIEKADEPLIRGATVRIAREGHTSGCDALAGFVATLMAANDSPG